MYLVQQGRLSLDDTVFGTNGILGTMYENKASPFTAWEKNITVRNLLEHTSGFVNIFMNSGGYGPISQTNSGRFDPIWTTANYQLDQWDVISDVLRRSHSSSAPGTRASYSNFGYHLLGRVIEKASGSSNYADYMKQSVLAPLFGVRDMDIGGIWLKTNEAATYGDNLMSPELGDFLILREAAAEWIASPTDILKILTAIDGLGARTDVFSATTRNSMFQKSKTRFSTFGLGWDEIVVDASNRTLKASKNRGLVGTNSWAVMDLRTNVSYAVVTNKRIMLGFEGVFKLKILIDGLVANVSDWPEHDLFEQVTRASEIASTTSQTSNSQTSTSRRQTSTGATNTRTSTATTTPSVMPEPLPTSTTLSVPVASSTSTNASPTPGSSPATADRTSRAFVLCCFLFSVAFSLLFF